MRVSLIILFLTASHFVIGQKNNILKIRFDGFYKTKAEIDKRDNDTTYEYLRFYSNGKVISVSSDGTAFDLKEWFKLGQENVSEGSYIFRKGTIYFSTTEKNLSKGTVIYKGKIKSQYCLILRSKSLINNYKSCDKFYFVAVPDLK